MTTYYNIILKEVSPLSLFIPQPEEAYAFGNQIIQNEQQYNIDCMSAITCFNGPVPPFFPYTNVADVAFSDFALVNQNTFQLNGMCLNASCINLATNYDGQQPTLWSNVQQSNNQQNLGIYDGSSTWNTGLNQAVQFATEFGTIFQSNDQYNIECIGSGCFNQAYNIGFQGFSTRKEGGKDSNRTIILFLATWKVHCSV